MSLITHLLSKDKKLSSYIKKTFGFYPNNITIFKLAFRHKSTNNSKQDSIQHNNERLEYLGDAVLNCIIAEYLFKTYPTKAEGFLTEMRSRIVSRKSLNRISLKLDFESMINRSDIAHKMSESVGGNAFEAITGAIFIDQGYIKTYNCIIDNIVKKYINLHELEHTEINFKSKILEWAQKNKQNVTFNIANQHGKSPSKTYDIELFINDKKYSAATDKSVKGAEQKAAQKAIQKLTQEGHDINTPSKKKRKKNKVQQDTTKEENS